MYVCMCGWRVSVSIWACVWEGCICAPSSCNSPTAESSSIIFEGEIFEILFKTSLSSLLFTAKSAPHFKSLYQKFLPRPFQGTANLVQILMKSECRRTQLLVSETPNLSRYTLCALGFVTPSNSISIWIRKNLPEISVLFIRSSQRSPVNPLRHRQTLSSTVPKQNPLPLQATSLLHTSAKSCENLPQHHQYTYREL